MRKALSILMGPHISLVSIRISIASASVVTGGNFVVRTPNRFIGRGVQITAGGSVSVKADRGIDTSSVAKVSVVERWDYRTGLFGQNASWI